MRRVDRYVLGEVFLPFSTGVGFFLALVAGLDILPRILNHFIKHHYPADQAILFILYSMPRLVGYVLPMAALYGTLSAVGRLSSESELDAINAGGIGFRRLSVAVIGFGLVASLATFGLNELLAPPANKAATDIVVRHMKKKKSGEYFLLAIPPADSGRPLWGVITAAAYDPARRQLYNVSVVRYRNGKPFLYLEAPEAHWKGTELHAKFTWTKREPNSTTTVDFSPIIDTGVPELLVAARTDKAQDMTLRELKERVQAIREADRVDDREALGYLTEFHVRIAGAFSALAFALVAAPLGVRATRSTTGLNLGMSMVVIFLYFVLAHVTMSLAKSGRMEPWMAAWLANGIVFLVGGYLYSRVFR